jgi:hypothetical protein
MVLEPFGLHVRGVLLQVGYGASVMGVAMLLWLFPAAVCVSVGLPVVALSVFSMLLLLLLLCLALFP